MKEASSYLLENERCFKGKKVSRIFYMFYSAEELMSLPRELKLLLVTVQFTLSSTKSCSSFGCMFFELFLFKCKRFFRKTQKNVNMVK